MPDEHDSPLQDLKDKIKSWANRAEMARKQGNGVLDKQALDRKRDYENALANFQEFKVDLISSRPQSLECVTDF